MEFEPLKHHKLQASVDMEQAIRHAINLVGPGPMHCLVCEFLTFSRGTYIPLDHKEDLGAGEHFESMRRLYSFALCDRCTDQAVEDQHEKVRERLRAGVKQSMKDSPETIQ
jgi:hypothetical protein